MYQYDTYTVYDCSRCNIVYHTLTLSDIRVSPLLYIAPRDTPITPIPPFKDNGCDANQFMAS